MDHDTTTRRRHPTTTTTTTTRQTTEVESGGPISSSPKRRNQQQLTRKRRRRRKVDDDDDDDDDDLSFSQLVFYVGTTLFVLCFISFWIYRKLSLSTTTTESKSSPLEYDDDDDNVVVTLQDSTPTTDSKSNSISETLKHIFQQEKEEKNEEEIVVPEPETPPPLPVFNLSKASIWDVYGILDQDNWMLDNTTTTTTNEIFWHAAKGLRQRFADLYGGENAARMLLDQGLTTFFSSSVGGAAAASSSSSSSFVVPYDIIHTACRFQQAEREHRPIRLAFAGYSVTAGRGNMFHQSFPFQLQRILNTVVQLGGITDGLQIRNAAIGGIPSFPYGFCFRNFLGNQPDVISWDYSMNEAGGVPEGLEAYIRHMITTYYPSVPKLIIKDTHMATLRQHVVHEYSSKSNNSKNWLHDAVILHTDPATKPFLDREEAHRPIGFQNWRTFGAPYGAPGQAHHHPALKEHELLGWILAMHFLTALEYKMIRGTNNLNCPDDPSSSSNKTTTKQREFLPPPVSKRLMMMMMTNQTNTAATVDNNNADYDPILFGHEIQKDQWVINPVQCRTTFQPILQGDLSEVIVSGSIAEDLDVLLPKSQMYYNDGWVLDMSEGEKAVKRKLSLYENSLGFIDSKEAYYGIFESPKLKLFLPYSSSSSNSSNSNNATAFLPKIGDAANDWYESIVLCQVNEKRIEQACNFGNDVSVTIGTKNISLSEYMMNDAGTLYLGKQVCSHIPIPDGATLTSHNELVNIDSDKLDIDQVGLVLQVFVSNAHIVHIHQACSVSHVVWEEKRRP